MAQHPAMAPTQQRLPQRADWRRLRTCCPSVSKVWAKRPVCRSSRLSLITYRVFLIPFPELGRFAEPAAYAGGRFCRYAPLAPHSQSKAPLAPICDHQHSKILRPLFVSFRVFGGQQSESVPIRPIAEKSSPLFRNVGKTLGNECRPTFGSGHRFVRASTRADDRLRRYFRAPYLLKRKFVRSQSCIT